MGIRGQKDVVAVLRVLGKFKFTSCSRSELVARRVIIDQVEAMRELIFQALHWNHEVMRKFLTFFRKLS